MATECTVYSGNELSPAAQDIAQEMGKRIGFAMELEESARSASEHLSEMGAIPKLSFTASGTTADALKYDPEPEIEWHEFTAHGEEGHYTYRLFIKADGSDEIGCIVLREAEDGTVSVSDPDTLEWIDDPGLSRINSYEKEGSTEWKVLTWLAGEHCVCPYAVKFANFYRLICDNEEIINLYGTVSRFMDLTFVGDGRIGLMIRSRLQNGITAVFEDGEYCILSNFNPDGGPVFKTKDIEEAESVLEYLADHSDGENMTMYIPLSGGTFAEVPMPFQAAYVHTPDGRGINTAEKANLDKAMGNLQDSVIEIFGESGIND